MLHAPSMLTYGFLSFSMAFLNKALFEIADFRNSLFVIFVQLFFVLLSFQLLGYIRLMPVPVMTRNDIYVFLVPSIFYSLSTVLSLQALMKLNVAIYVVIKVSSLPDSVAEFLLERRVQLRISMSESCRWWKSFERVRLARRRSIASISFVGTAHCSCSSGVLQR